MEGINAVYFVLGLFGAIFTFIGTVFVTISMVITNRRKSWHRTIGIITNDRAIFKSLPNSYPIAKYTVNGVEYEHHSNIKQSPGPPAGKEVEVLYNPDNPKQAGINTLVQSGGIFKIIGAIFIPIGLLCWILLLVIHFIIL